MQIAEISIRRPVLATVLSQGGNLYVYRLAAAPAQGGSVPEGTAEVNRVEVTLGARLGGRVEAISGVAAGERVVVAGQQRLNTPTARVRLAAAPAAGASEPAATASAPAATASAPAGAASAGAPAAALRWHRASTGGNACAVASRG